jgi:hypothetical protein
VSRLKILSMIRGVSHWFKKCGECQAWSECHLKNLNENVTQHSMI